MFNRVASRSCDGVLGETCTDLCHTDFITASDGLDSSGWQCLQRDVGLVELFDEKCNEKGKH